MNLNCAKNHELRFVVYGKEGTHWCAMCELEAARQEIKDLKLELSAREYLDHEANIGAQLVNEELRDLRAARDTALGEVERLREVEKCANAFMVFFERVSPIEVASDLASAMENLRAAICTIN